MMANVIIGRLSKRGCAVAAELAKLGARRDLVAAVFMRTIHVEFDRVNHKHAYDFRIIPTLSASLRTMYACHTMSNTKHSFGFLLSDTGRLVGKRFDQHAKSVINLSRAQCSVLANLERYPNINQAQLADLLSVTPIAIARLLDRMEIGGWIARRDDPSDRRVRRLTMTDKARNTLSQAKAVGLDVTSEALAGFSAAERKSLSELLERVRHNLLVATDAGLSEQ
jgi:DNA-binding MarR family transcriptional regulator